MLFLSDLSRQERGTYTTTSQQEFDVPDSPTSHGEEKGFSQTTNTRWRQVGHEIALLPEYAGKLNTCSNLAECAEKPEDTSRTSPCAPRTGSNKSCTLQSTRMDQTKDSALPEVHKRHGFTLLRVRGHKLVLGRAYQAGTVRYTRTRSTTPKRMTMIDANNAALFLMG